MVKAVLFDLFETLITESRTGRPACPRLLQRLGVNARPFVGTGKRCVLL